MKTLSTLVACLALCSVAAATPIVAIYGSGNPNTGWTAETENGITLALRAKNRTNGSTPTDGLGTYSFANAPGPRGLWNYEFSINSGTAMLTAFTYVLRVDRDPSAGILYSSVDPLSYWWDNSYGVAGTLNGQGVEGPSFMLAGSNSIVQNSQNITFGGYPGGALALEQNATYNYQLVAFNGQGQQVADVSMRVVVGQGGAAVPDTGSTVALLGLSMLALVGFRRRQAR